VTEAATRGFVKNRCVWCFPYVTEMRAVIVIVDDIIGDWPISAQIPA
jgi:hypothetical protein